MNNFWQKLERPIMVLAPMADVTDAAFRHIIAKYGKPDVMWTEFVSADGLALAPEAGRKKLLKDLEYSEAERPIVAQFFTSSPEHMKGAAEHMAKLGFDGVDINMGCPDKSVEKQGAGASLMRNVSLARELVKAAKEGAPNSPISVKTRTGYSRPDLENWLPEILKEDPAIVTIHARTRKEMSKEPTQWEFIRRAVEIRDLSGKKTLIFGNPWLFSERKPEIQEKLRVMVEHTNLFEKLLGAYKNFAIMKKHFKAYVTGFDGAGNLRVKLMDTNNASEVEAVINDFLLYFSHEK